MSSELVTYKDLPTLRESSTQREKDLIASKQLSEEVRLSPRTHPPSAREPHSPGRLRFQTHARPLIRNPSHHRLTYTIRSHTSRRVSQRSGTFKESHASLKKQYEEIKAALGADEVAVSLDELEQKMRHHEQTVYMLSEYIDTKVSERHGTRRTHICAGRAHAGRKRAHVHVPPAELDTRHMIPRRRGRQHGSPLSPLTPSVPAHPYRTRTPTRTRTHPLRAPRRCSSRLPRSATTRWRRSTRRRSAPSPSSPSSPPPSLTELSAAKVPDTPPHTASKRRASGCAMRTHARPCSITQRVRRRPPVLAEVMPPRRAVVMPPGRGPSPLAPAQPKNSEPTNSWPR